MSRTSNVDVAIRLRNARRFKKDVSDSAAELEKFGVKGAKALGDFALKADDLKKTGKTLTKRVTLPLLGLGTGAVTTAVKWETAFAGVRKTVDATEAQFASLDAGLRGMSTEIPVSAPELAEIAEAAGQLGIQTKNIEGFTRVMADLGVATNLTSTDAASKLARLANITQMPQTEFDRLGSTVVALGNNLATTESEIVDMATRIAGAGNQIGLTEDQILSFSAALSSVGIRAEAGGSGISTTLLNMHSAVKAGGDDLKAFADIAGMSSKDFRAAWEDDAAQATINFVEGLGKLKAEGGDVSQTLKDLGLGGTRIREILMNASGAGDLFRDSLALGADAWEDNTALTKEAEERYKTFESQLAMLKNTLFDLGVTVGQALMPPLQDLMGIVAPAIADLASAFGDLNPQQQKMILIAGGLAAAIGPLTYALGVVAGGVGRVLLVTAKLIRGFNALRFSTAATRIQLGLLAAQEKTAAVLRMIGHSTAGTRVQLALLAAQGKVAAVMQMIRNASVGLRIQLALLTVQTKLATVAQYLLSTAFLANPIVLIVVGIAALAAGFVVAYKKVDWFRNAIDAVWATIKGWAAAIKRDTQGIQAAFKWLGNGIADVFSFLMPIFVKVHTFLAKTVFAALRIYFKIHVKVITTVVKAYILVAKAAIAAGKAMVVAGKWMVQAALDAGQFLMPAFEVIGGVIKTVFVNTFRIITDIFFGIVDVVGGFVQLIDAIFRGDFSDMGEAVKRIFLGIGKVMTAPLRAVFRIAWELSSGIRKVFGDAFSKVRGFAGSAASWITGKFTDVISFFTGLPAKVATAVSGMFDGLKEAFRSAINWILRKWNDLEIAFGGQKISMPSPAPDISVPRVSLKTPDVPLLADGGIIRRGGVAVVGEAGPELISAGPGARVDPLPDGPGGLMPALELTVNLIVDGRKMGEVTIDRALEQAALA